MKNGKYIEPNGTIRWYKNGHIHREDGPAIIYSDGQQEWYLNGKLHRTDGPAIIYTDGVERWFIDNIELTKKKFQIYLIQQNLNLIL